MDLIIENNDLAHDIQIDIDNAKLDLLIASSSDDSWGIGNLIQIPLADIIRLIWRENVQDETDKAIIYWDEETSPGNPTKGPETIQSIFYFFDLTIV